MARRRAVLEERAGGRFIPYYSRTGSPTAVRLGSWGQAPLSLDPKRWWGSGERGPLGGFVRFHSYQRLLAMLEQRDDEIVRLHELLYAYEGSDESEEEHDEERAHLEMMNTHNCVRCVPPIRPDCPAVNKRTPTHYVGL